MTALKVSTENVNTTESLICPELLMLDSYIADRETNRQVVLNQIRMLATLFNTLRNVGSVKEPDWKFLNQEE